MKCFVILFIIILSGCSIGDGVLEVEGALLDEDGQPYARCEIELYRKGQGMQYGRKEVASEFRETFIVEPKSAEYYFIINCNGALASYSTPTFEFDGLNPVLMKNIEIQRKMKGAGQQGRQ